jgi:hypothetical protein
MKYPKLIFLFLLFFDQTFPILDANAKDLFGKCEISHKNEKIEIGQASFSIGRELGSGLSSKVFLLETNNIENRDKVVLKRIHTGNKNQDLLQDLIFHHVASRLKVSTTKTAMLFSSETKFDLIKKFVSGRTLSKLSDDRLENIEVVHRIHQAETLMDSILNHPLQKCLTDLHDKNIMVSNEGTIKVIDGILNHPYVYEENFENLSTSEQSLSKDITEVYKACHNHYDTYDYNDLKDVSCVNGELLLNGIKPQVSDENSLAPIPLLPENLFKLQPDLL